MYRRPLTFVQVVWLALAGGCAVHRPVVPGGILPNSLPDSAIFKAATETLRDSTRAIVKRTKSPRDIERAGYSLAIDPRPYILRPEDVGSWPWVPSASGLGEAAPDAVAARERVLEQLAVPRGDLLALDACPGAISEPEERLKCPREPKVVALLSLPKFDGERAAMQAYVLVADSRSKMGYSVTYYLRQKDGRWLLVGQSPGVILE